MIDDQVVIPDNKFVQGTSSSKATSSGSGGGDATSSAQNDGDDGGRAAVYSRMRGRLIMILWDFQILIELS